MKRKMRSPAELEQTLDRNEDLRFLFETLSRDERLVVQPDGKNACIFKVYRPGHTGPKEGFLRVLSPLNRSYVDWSQQPPSCRVAFASIVKNEKMLDGSEIRHGTTVEDMVRTVQ